jgi:DNA-binding NarL/FixJ family response regulator
MKHASLATTVLGLLTDGFRYKEIAGELGISLDTVREHARRIYTKLHVSSRTEAVVKYMGGTKNDGRL